MLLKKLLLCAASVFLAGSLLTAEVSVKSSEFVFEGTVKMKVASVTDSRYPWRDLLYSENPVEEGSKQDYKILVSDLVKGYVNPVLFQRNGNSIKLNTNGKEQFVKPGVVFSAEKGVVWLSFTAPDKKTYQVPTSIKVTPKAVVIPEEKIVEEQDESESYSSLETEVPEADYDDLFFFKNASMIPQNGKTVGEYVNPVNQKINKGYNEQVVIKNLPAGTKPRIFLMDSKEVLVYLAPDLTLHNDENCFTLFYCVRRANRDEEFSQPKRVLDNPKVDGKLCNIMEFDGIVAPVSGKRRLVLVWTQATVSKNQENTEEDVYKSTAIFTANWKEDDQKFSVVERVSDVCGSLQFHPSIYSNGNGVQLEITKRPDNRLKDEEASDFILQETRDYYSLEKTGKWKPSVKEAFGNYKSAYPFTDSNSRIASDFNYVLYSDGSVAGALWSQTDTMLFPGSVNCFVKTYIKNPETKKMAWTESIPVVYHNVNHKVLFPSGIVRANGDFLITYLSEAAEGNSICVARISNEPCINTLSMEPNTEDLQTPGKNVRFKIKLINMGLGLAENCDIIVKNELKTDAGKITAKKVFLPGVVYTCDSIYEKLKGKDGVVPVENVKGEVKLPKARQNSPFSTYEAKYTLGIPEFTFGDVFTTTKGNVQTVTFTAGTQNGVKVKPPVSEVVVTQSANDDYYDFEKKVREIPVNYDISDQFLEMNFTIPVTDEEISEYFFDMLIHFRPQDCKVSGFDSKTLEKMTSKKISFVVENPEYYKDSYELAVTGTSFTKKTKIMETQFTVTNNWAHALSEEVTVSLFNKNSGLVEQSVQIPLELEVLQNKKFDITFDPAESEDGSAYEIVIE